MAKLQLFPHIPNIFHHKLLIGLQFNLLFAQNDNKSLIQTAKFHQFLQLRKSVCLFNRDYNNTRLGQHFYAIGALLLRHWDTTSTPLGHYFYAIGSLLLRYWVAISTLLGIDCFLTDGNKQNNSRPDLVGYCFLKGSVNANGYTSR